MAPGVQLGMAVGYDRPEASAPQGVLASDSAGLVAWAAEHAPLPGAPGEELVVVDCGCGPGNNSVVPVLAAARALQRRLAAAAGRPGSAAGAKLRVRLLHEDVRGNDWQAVARAVRAYEAAAADECPSLELRPELVPHSFYGRVAPDASISLGFCLVAIHWQRSCVVAPRHAVNLMCSAVTPDERVLLTAAAKANMRRFYRLRAAEFVPGGLLVVTHTAHGGGPDTPLSSCAGIALSQATAEAMVADGLLHERELGHMAMPQFCLSLDEVRDVLASPGVAEVWEPLLARTQLTVSPSWAAFQRGELTPLQLAQEHAAFWRPLALPYMQAGLRRCGRSEAEVASLTAAFFQRFVDVALAAGPTPVAFPGAVLMLRRRGAGLPPLPALPPALALSPAARAAAAAAAAAAASAPAQRCGSQSLCESDLALRAASVSSLGEVPAAS